MTFEEEDNLEEEEYQLNGICEDPWCGETIENLHQQLIDYKQRVREAIDATQWPNDSVLAERRRIKRELGL